LQNFSEISSIAMAVEKLPHDHHWKKIDVLMSQSNIF